MTGGLVCVGIISPVTDTNEMCEGMNSPITTLFSMFLQNNV